MSSVEKATTVTRESSHASGLIAVNWPLRDQPLIAASAMAGCCAVALVAGWGSSSLTMGILSGGVLAAAMWQLWIPVRTQLGPTGVTLAVLGRQHRISWREIDHLDLLDAGVLLCGEPVADGGNPLRSLFLPWGKDRAAIAAFCQQYRSLRPFPSSTSQSDPRASSGMDATRDA